MILANHGTVSLGETIEQAYWWTEILDAYCRILLLAKDLGRVNYFTEAETRELLALKKQGQNRYVPVDIVWEAIAGRASFVARTFSGDPKQMKALITAGIHHRGIAVIDVISPCVTFNNSDDSFHSYAWGKSHEVALHELSFVPPVKAIKVDYEEGETLDVPLYDGTHIILKKLTQDYEPTDRAGALQCNDDGHAPAV